MSDTYGICRCDPTHGQSCPVCDGTLDEQRDELDLIEPCIALDAGELCDHRAEPGSPYCVEHQLLDVTRWVAA